MFFVATKWLKIGLVKPWKWAYFYVFWNLLKDMKQTKFVTKVKKIGALFFIPVVSQKVWLMFVHGQVDRGCSRYTTLWNFWIKLQGEKLPQSIQKTTVSSDFFKFIFLCWKQLARVFKTIFPLMRLRDECFGCMRCEFCECFNGVINICNKTDLVQTSLQTDRL